MEDRRDRLQVVRSDITTLAVDAIVNAANRSLLGGGGVDGAIHRAAGPQLRACCAGLGGCPTGEARITPGFRLPAKHVIHTVGPVWHGGKDGESELLAACYRATFALAREHALRSLAIPAVSCGAYGFPKASAARIAVEECARALAQEASIERVLLVAFDAEMAALYSHAIRAHTADPG
jgi:O-acetyl-ADP-ribose deacetylase (regulator of RNase III)